MSPDEFRLHGHQVVDWIADYLANPESRPVLPSVKPGDVTRALPKSPPEHGEPMARILQDFETTIVPGLTLWNHPGFLAYFAISATGPGILAEMLTAALNVNVMLWKSSPAGTELEQVTLGWLREWLGLPAEFFGIIYDTASSSTMHAIAAAREMAAPEVRLEGGSTNLVLYTSEHAHSSVEKAAIAIGVGQRNVRKIATDAEFRMRPDALLSAIEQDLAGGLRPFCVVPTVGTTSITSIDPVREIAAVAERFGLWVHIDAAYGGTAAILPECRYLLDAAEQAHSIVVNPHKWMGTPIDLSVLYTRRPDILRRAFSMTPEYLRTSEDPQALNFMDYSVQLGRRFRGLKLWFVMREYGREGISEKIRGHIARARELATDLEADPRFEICAPVTLSLVCFRLHGGDEANRTLMERVNATGKFFLSHTVLHGRFVLRAAVGNYATERRHILELAAILRELAPRE
ncbi:MAG: pyridoxal-dependent decarboxylase [Bryobacteraceae bacterium]